MSLFRENILNEDLSVDDITRQIAFNLVKSGAEYFNTSIRNETLAATDLDSFRVF